MGLRARPPRPRTPDARNREIAVFACTLESVPTELGCTRQRADQLQKTALSKLHAYAVSRLGREPQDLDEVAALFDGGPHPIGVMDAWRARQRRR